MIDDPREHETDLPAPPRLVEDLGAIYGSTAPVPAAVNDAILNRARAQFARSSRWRTLRLVGAAAAVACLFGGLRLAYHRGAVEIPPDASARVTIVDALKLAHQIKSGRSGKDVNGDGSVNQLDVDALAMLAVALDHGGVQ